MAFVRNCFRITEADRRSETIVWFNAGSTPREGFGLRQYNYDELAEATDKFSNRNFLGEGGFSLVYEGILDGKKVAIKKLKIRPDERSQSEEESKEEIKVISRVSHKNLVKLLGYCIEGDDILLILEYVPKKSLKHHLHGETTLEWTKRMKIAIGTAKGLEYLHENCTPKIIHRDVKAENILIDDKYEPKIADFGLALLFPETGSPTHITRSNKGTQVYADSEYYPQKVSEKSDVYAYGVVLLELISGRKTTFEGTDIVFWAKPQIEYALRSGDYTNLVDSKLLQMNYNKKEMKTMISCAMACVYKPSSSRPKMNQIVRALEGYICIEEIRNDKNDNLFPKVISLFGTSFAFPTGIDSTLSNGAQGPDPSFLDPTPTNGRDDPPDARLPNGGGQVQSICAELKSVEGYIRIGETQFEKNDNIFPKMISAFGTSFAFPTGIDSTLSNGTQGPDPTPTNGRDDPPDARLPNGGGQVQSISAESESVDGKESRSLNDGENGVTSRDSTLVASCNEVEAEWYEPGVHITLVALRDGTRDLKRVRFRRRRFNEQQAETWWSENREKVYEKYNILGWNQLGNF